jgi:hypothetical protein
VLSELAVHPARRLDADDWWVLAKIVEHSLGGLESVAFGDLKGITRDERFDARTKLLQRGLEESIHQLARSGYVFTLGDRVKNSPLGARALGRRLLDDGRKGDLRSAAIGGRKSATYGGVGAMAAEFAGGSAETSTLETGIIGAGLLGATAFGTGYALRTRARSRGLAPHPMDAMDKPALELGRALLDLHAGADPMTREHARKEVETLTKRTWNDDEFTRALGQLMGAQVVARSHGWERDEIVFTDYGMKLALARAERPPRSIEHDVDETVIDRTVKVGPATAGVAVSIERRRDLSPIQQAVLYVASSVQHETDSDVNVDQIVDGMNRDWRDLRKLTGISHRTGLTQQVSEALEDLIRLELMAKSSTGAVMLPDGFEVAEDMEWDREELEASPALTTFA